MSNLAEAGPRIARAKTPNNGGNRSRYDALGNPLLTWVNMAVRCPPIPTNKAIIGTAMSKEIKPYSIAVTPRSDLINAPTIGCLRLIQNIKYLYIFGF